MPKDEKRSNKSLSRVFTCGRTIEVALGHPDSGSRLFVWQLYVAVLSQCRTTEKFVKCKSRNAELGKVTEIARV